MQSIIMRNAGLEEAQARIKIVGRNINNLRYANDSTLMAESKEKLRSLLMKEESEKAGLKLRMGFLVAQLVKNPPAMQETWVPFLGWEDPLEMGKATYSSILAWRIPRTV